MPSELSIQERLLFDQITEDFNRPPSSIPLSPAMRFLAGIVVALGGVVLLFLTIKSAPVAFGACLIMTAGASLTVHARLRLRAFPSLQWPVSSPDRRAQRRRPVPGRPRLL